MIIREGTINEIDKIYKLGEAVDEFDTTDEIVIFWPKHILRNCIESQSDWLLVAEENQQLIGFIICNNSPVFKKAVIENVFVSPQYRKKGVAKKLLDYLLNEIKSTDCEYVVIFAEGDNNTAIDFYVQNGFNRGKNFAWIDKALSKEFSKS